MNQSPLNSYEVFLESIFFFIFFFIQVIFTYNASASVYAGLPAMTESEEKSLSVSVINGKRKIIYIHTRKW